MFTWICPQCGREVPPAYTECPDCTRKSQPVATAAPPPSSLAIREPAAAEPPPDVKPLAAPIEPDPSSVSQAPAALPPQPAARRHGLPVWLATVLSTLAIAGIVAGVYWIVNSHGGRSGRPTAAEESPGAKPGAPVSAIQKFIEVSSEFSTDLKWGRNGPSC